MKRLVIFFIVCLLSSLIQAQSSKKWQVIFEDSDKIIYLDTKNIREIDNTLSVWSLIVYKSFTETDDMGRRIGKIKKQVIFNRYTKKYAEIGTLVYDEIGRMIKNNSNFIAGTQPNKLENLIKDDPEIEVLYNKALEHIGAKPIESGNQMNDDMAENSDTPIPVDDTSNNEPSDDFVFDSVDDTDYSEDNSSNQVGSLSNKKENVIVFRGSKDPIEPAEPVGEIEPETKNEYDVENETLVTGVVFSDGNTFVVQKASFKNQNMANKEAERLKRKGEDAFVTKAYIASKGGTWYRVRVGYFNSLEEARSYIRTH